MKCPQCGDRRITENPVPFGAWKKGFRGLKGSVYTCRNCLHQFTTPIFEF